MKENVGDKDQLFRSALGPLLIAAGYFRLGGRDGEPAGLMLMIAGVLTIESAITRVCPINSFLGIDTRERRGALPRIQEKLGRR